MSEVHPAVAQSRRGEVGRGDALRFVSVGGDGHVSLETVRAFEAALSRAGVERMDTPVRLFRPIGKILAKGGLLRGGMRRRGRPFVVTMMGPLEFQLFPISLLAPVVVYAFDVWPPQFKWWAQVFSRHRVTEAFFTSKVSADWFSTRGVLESAIWLPEGTTVDQFLPERALRDRTIDVLEMGRRHRSVHEAILRPLSESGLVHRYQSSDRTLVFPSRGALIQGLADTRVSVCYPASDTHPVLAAGADVLTQRYLEALASGCLIVGRAPADLIALLGFDPVVRMDERDPAGHLKSILARIDEYQELVDRGLRRVREVGGWDDRARRLIAHVSKGAP